MAYDPGAAYEPPSRSYYQNQNHPQQHQLQQYQHHQAPVHKQYSGRAQQQYNDYGQHSDQGYTQPQQPHAAYDVYAQNINRGYDQGYDQHYTNGDFQNYDHNYTNGYMPNEYASDPQYDQGHHQRPPDNYAPERQYDPRYQHRPGRGNYMPPDQRFGPRSQPKPPPEQHSQGHPAPFRRHDLNGQQRQNPSNGYPPQQQAYQPEPGPQRRPDPRNAPPEPQNRRDRQEQRVQHAKPAIEAPKKMTMEEWKANERAKLHAAADKPKVIPQDNAFPSFPAKKKEPRAGVHSSASSRTSEDPGRPSTSDSSNRPHERRPGTAGSVGHSHPSPPQVQRGGQQLQRPTADRQHSFEPIAELPSHELQTQPVQDRQQPLYDGTGSARVQPRQQPVGNQPLPHNTRPDPRQLSHASAERNVYDDQPSQHRAQGPPAPAQTQGFEAHRAQARAPREADAYAKSPAPLPPAIHAQSQARQQTPQQQLFSPTSQYSHPDTPQEYERHQPNALGASAHHRKQMSSLADVYDGYYDAEPAPALAVQPRNRDEEIELEMPDFDSAAPKQTRTAHKRNQTVDKDLGDAQSALPPAMPAMLPNTSIRSPPPQQQREYGHSQDAVVSSQPEFRNGSQHQGGAMSGFVFELPADQPPPHPRYDGQSHSAAQQHALEYQSIQPPFIDDELETRSLNGPHQMQIPVRGGPPMHAQGPRFHSNGRGPLPPQSRPDLDRHPTSQTFMSDPGQQRMGSAPPLGQGIQEPPPHRPSPLGAPISKQRSAPDAPQPYRQERHSNPDALPAHPVPVRPGLAQPGAPQGSKPAPMRNHGNGSISSTGKSSVDIVDKPVTQAELQHLRATAESTGSLKTALLYAKKLVEASTVLASEDGRADPKTTQRNREKYILEAHKRVKKLVSAGYPEAQFYLADCYGQGSLGLEVDTKEAFNLYQAAAKAGHAQAAYRTAVCCEMGPEEGGGTRRDYPKAVQWYRRAAALGDVAAMFKLGMILLKGLLGQPRNVGESVTWLKRAAERADLDNPHALHELGLLYEPGNTNPEIRSKVLPDEAYALSLYRQAADLGYKHAQFRLGQAYEYGTLGLPIDNRMSISFYSKAAAKGEHQAELALSGWYLTGADGILEHNETEAYLWARKAAISEPPLAKAMFAMGYFSEQGIGCPQNIDEARRWYGRAASYKFPKAVERLEEMRKSGHKKPVPANGKLTRKDQKRDEENCSVM